MHKDLQSVQMALIRKDNADLGLGLMMKATCTLSRIVSMRK